MKRFIIFITLIGISLSASAQFPASSKIFCYMEVAKETVDTGVKEQITDPMYYFVMFGNDGKLAVDFDRRESFLLNIKKNNDYYRETLTKKLNEFDSNRKERASLLGREVEFYSETPISRTGWGDGKLADYFTTCYEPSYSNSNQVAYRTSWLSFIESIAITKDVNRMYSPCPYPGRRYYDNKITYSSEVYIFNLSRSQMVIVHESKISSDTRYYLEKIDMNLLLPEKKSYEVF